MFHQLSQTTHYWWCWLAIGVAAIGYAVLLNVLIVIFLLGLSGHFTHSPLTAVTNPSAVPCKGVSCKHGRGGF